MCAKVSCTHLGELPLTSWMALAIAKVDGKDSKIWAWSSTPPMANAFMLEGGYGLPTATWSPWLRMGVDWASGDSNASDGMHQTFFNMAPTNHKFYGAMDFLSWQNLMDPYLKATIAPMKGLSFALTYNAYWLATTSEDNSSNHKSANGMKRTS